MSKKRYLFRVRFKVDGKPKTFKTTARTPEDAAKRIKTKGARVISVVKAN